jgi:hypothetical protein
VSLHQAEWIDDQPRYDAHREAWAETGDLAELNRMLRHVTPGAAPAFRDWNWMKTESIGGGWFQVTVITLMALAVVAGLVFMITWAVMHS